MGNKVSYRKQTASQHVNQEFLAMAGGAIDPVKSYFSSILIATQNLVAVYRTLYRVGGWTECLNKLGPL